MTRKTVEGGRWRVGETEKASGTKSVKSAKDKTSGVGRRATGVKAGKTSDYGRRVSGIKTNDEGREAASGSKSQAKAIRPTPDARRPSRGRARGGGA